MRFSFFLYILQRAYPDCDIRFPPHDFPPFLNYHCDMPRLMVENTAIWPYAWVTINISNWLWWLYSYIIEPPQYQINFAWVNIIAWSLSNFGTNASLHQSYIVISVRLWNFKDGGSLKASFLPKNQHAQRKFWYRLVWTTYDFQ